MQPDARITIKSIGAQTITGKLSNKMPEPKLRKLLPLTHLYNEPKYFFKPLPKYIDISYMYVIMQMDKGKRYTLS